MDLEKERDFVRQQLQESERQMRTLLANLPGMSYRFRNVPEWTMTFVSEECRELTGYKPEVIIEKTKVFNALGWPRQKATGCKHSLPWPHMCRTGVNPAESGSQIWSLSASGGAIIVMFHEASGKKKIRLC